MNKQQLIALWVGVALVTLMGLFLPYRISHYFKGYHPIWDPPKPCVVDVQRLAIQWAIVAGVTGVAVVSLRSRKG